MHINKIMSVIEKKFKGRAYCNDNGTCQYLTSDGRQCAVGLFIPKNHIGSSYSGGVAQLLNKYPYLAQNMPSKEVDLLQEFQQYHDDINPNDNSHVLAHRFKTLDTLQQTTALMFAAYGLFKKEIL